MKRTTIINLLMALAAVLVITYLYPHQEASHYKFEEGRPWNYAKLIAPFDIPIRPDSATVRSVRDSLDRTFAPVFARNNNALNEVVTALMTKWQQDDSEESPTAYETSMRKRAISFLNSEYIKDVIDPDYSERIENGTLPYIRILDANIVSKHNTRNVTTPEKVATEMATYLSIDTAAAGEWIRANDILDALSPSLTYQRETSERLYQEDLNELNARMGTGITGVIQQGQTIIDKGAIITSQDFTNLHTYERMVEEQLSSSHRNKWMMWLGQFFYAVLLITALLAFLRFSARSVWDNQRAMMFVFLSIVLFFILGIALDSSIDNGCYLAPFAIVPVLMIVFFDAPTAIYSSVTLILLMAGTVSFPLEFIVLEAMATVAAVYSLKELSNRSQLLRTSLFVLIAYLVGYFSIELMMNGSAEGLTWRMVIYLAVSAALSSMAYILMVAIERMFGFVSIVTLIELADTNNPLLRELSQECPGTFQHSIAVSNLATDAAIKLGANEQLVRAGALYHDIGKMANPNFYTENQHGVNPHDTLPAEQSARIIIGHIADGVKRAEKEGLPGVVKDFILQHHGKGKAKYFYFTYCNQHPGEEVDPAPFTYPGPNPQTREASLLMMADSVEAASRSLKEHTPESIASLVNKIIDSQIADGLHNDSTLMFRDIPVIKEAFIHRLMTIYHSRIVYPDDPHVHKA